MKKNQCLVIQGGYRHYEVIDYLKGFSILTIVIMHLIQVYLTEIPSIISKLATIGGTGVHVFIFCSGFGLYMGYTKQPKTFKDFIILRLRKIYIPYILIVLISFCIPWTYTESDRIIALLSHIFLFKMFCPKYEQSFGGQLWFISTIIQFYLVFVPLWHLKKKMRSTKLFLMCTGFISVLWWVTMAVTGNADVRIWGSFFLQYLWEFCLGMAIAEYLIENNEIRIPVSVLITSVIGGISLSALAVYGNRIFAVFNDIPALIGYGALALYIYHLSNNNKYIIDISCFSYEWYLVHILVFLLVFRIPASSLVAQCCLGIMALILNFIIAIGYSMIFKFEKKKKIN